MRKIVGYFEGTDSTLLTALVCDGYDTVPISNGFDNHGMHVRIINNENKVDLLVGYVHKIFAPEDSVQAGGVTYDSNPLRRNAPVSILSVGCFFFK